MLAFWRALALGVDTIDLDDQMSRLERNNLARARIYHLHTHRHLSDSAVALNVQRSAIHTWIAKYSAAMDRRRTLRIPRTSAVRLVWAAERFRERE